LKNLGAFWLLFALVMTAPLFSGSVNADEAPACLDCHRASADSPVHAIFNTVHGKLAGGGGAGCLSCHGSSESHRSAPSTVAPDISFGPRWPASAEQRDNSCLACHESGDQLFWQGSAHQGEALSCDSCHNSHQQQDLKTAKVEANEQCINCHTDIRAEINLPSRHPIVEGKTACTDCHNPHGGAGDASLHQVSLNDNCLSCHQEKRGPFLWEHAPVAEDCALCHRAHGSVHPRLLSARGPTLCQQCHAAAFHPSLPYGAEGLAGGSANQNVLGKNCLNCHSQVHGSNHPSGARLTR
jgi:DmsE family decaheme c-type cytochrome